VPERPTQAKERPYTCGRARDPTQGKERPYTYITDWIFSDPTKAAYAKERAT